MLASFITSSVNRERLTKALLFDKYINADFSLVLTYLDWSHITDLRYLLLQAAGN